MPSRFSLKTGPFDGDQAAHASSSHPQRWAVPSCDGMRLKPKRRWDPGHPQPVAGIIPSSNGLRENGSNESPPRDDPRGAFGCSVRGAWKEGTSGPRRKCRTISFGERRHGDACFSVCGCSCWLRCCANAGRRGRGNRFAPGEAGESVVVLPAGAGMGFPEGRFPGDLVRCRPA